MNKNPFINAVLAGAYIVLIVSVIKLFSTLGGPEESIFIPMTMISLLVLSVALMGFLFFYEPLRLLMNNQMEAAASFFVKKLGAFAVIVVIFVVLLFSKLIV